MAHPPAFSLKYLILLPTLGPALLATSLGFAAAAPGAWRPAATLNPKQDAENIQVFQNEASSEKITLSYQIPSCKTSTAQFTYYGGKYDRIECGNALYTENEGEPIVPFIPVNVIIPQGKALDHIDVQFDGALPIPLSHPLAFSLPLVPVGSCEIKRISPDPAIYGSNATYPRQSHELVTVQNKCGVSVAYINVFPVSYSPASHLVNAHRQFTVTITFKANRNEDTSKATWVENIDKPFLQVENLDELDNYRSKPAAEGTYENKLCLPFVEASYVVVTSKELSEAKTSPSLSDLLAHRQKGGLSTAVMTIEKIKAEYKGADDAEKLKNFIKDAYNNWKTKYVFLAGGRQVLPVKKLKADWVEAPSDLYFQCLSKDFSEVTADVYIGRALAANAQALSNIIHKTIAYETDDASKPYLNTAFFAGEHLFDSNHEKEIMDATLSMEYIRKRIFGLDASVKFKTLYNTDKKWGGPEFLAEVNSNSFSTITHLGHGKPTKLFFITSSEAESKIQNTSYLFLITQACWPGAFDRDCIGESFTTKTKYGFWGGVMNSQLGWEPQGGDKGEGETKNIDGPSFRLQVKFWEALFKNGVNTAGKMNAYAHEANIPNLSKPRQRWTIYESNLLADPAVKFRMKGATK